MSDHFDDNELADLQAPQRPWVGRMNCGDCPAITGGGCKAGHCLKAPVSPPKIQIGPLDV